MKKSEPKMRERLKTSFGHLLHDTHSSTEKASLINNLAHLERIFPIILSGCHLTWYLEVWQLPKQIKILMLRWPLIIHVHWSFLFFKFFYWRIIALQNFVVFCQTSTWISHRYTYIPSFLNLPPISLPIASLQVDREPLFGFSEPYSKFPLAIYFTYGNVSFHITLSIHLTLSCPLPMSISLFSMSISPLLPCK